MPFTEPIVFSGFSYNPFKASLQYLYDPTISGYRALQVSDFATTTTGIISVDAVGLSGGFVGISGTAQTRFTNSGIYASGIRVPATALSGNSGVSGSPSPFYTSAENGVLFVQQANTHYTQDSVRSVPLQGASVATGGRQGIQTGASSFTVFPANSSRNMLFVQNLNTGSVFLSLSGAASSVNFNMILAAGTALDDAKGGSWSTDTWLGSVSVSGANGYRITAFEY